MQSNEINIYITKITYTEEERYLQTSLCPPPYFSENQKYKCKDNTKQAKITLHITDLQNKISTHFPDNSQTETKKREQRETILKQGK